MNATISAMLEREPDLGASDESLCMESWLASVSREYEKGEGMKLSHAAVGALLHTLVAANQRHARLIRERDANRVRGTSSNYIIVDEPWGPILPCE